MLLFKNAQPFEGEDPWREKQIEELLAIYDQQKYGRPDQLMKDLDKLDKLQLINFIIYSQHRGCFKEIYYP